MGQVWSGRGWYGRSKPQDVLRIGLSQITALVSIYLFRHVGVEAWPNQIVSEEVDTHDNMSA